MYISDHHLDILRAIKQAENGLSTDEVVNELKNTGFIWADTNKVASLLYYMRKKDLVVAMEGSYNRPKINRLTAAGETILANKGGTPSAPGSREPEPPDPENDKAFIEPLIPVSAEEFLGDEVEIANPEPAPIVDAETAAWLAEDTSKRDAPELVSVNNVVENAHRLLTLDADDPVEYALITLLKVIHRHEVQPAPVILDVDLKVQLLRKLAKLAHPDFGDVLDKIAEDLLRLK